MAKTEFGDEEDVNQIPTTTEFGDAVDIDSSDERISSVPYGGLGMPIPREEAKKIAAQRLVAREREAGFRPGDLLLRSEAEQLASEAGIPLGDVGEVVSTSQFAPTLQGNILRAITLGRQGASAASLGTAGALGRLVEDAVLNPAQQRILGSQALQQRAPQEAALGDIIGSGLPGGLVGRAAVSQGAPLIRKVIETAKIGAPVGATALGSKTIEEQGLDVNPMELIENTLLGGTGGALLGGAIPVIGAGGAKALTGAKKGVEMLLSPIKSLENMGVLRSSEALATGILNPAGQGEVREVAEGILDGKIIKGFESIKQTSSFQDAPTLIDSSRNALRSRSGQINSFISENPNIAINGEDAAEAMIARVNKDPLTLERNPEVISLIEANADQLRRNFSLREAFDRLNSINARHENYFTASVKGQTTKLQDAEFASDEVMRKYLSVKLNDAIEGVTGLAKNPFREYGMINEILNQTTKRYQEALVGRLKEIDRTGVVSDFIQKFDFSKPLASITRPLQFLRGGELGRLNRRVSSLNDKLDTRRPTQVLTEAERIKKLKGKVKTPPLTSQAQAQLENDARIMAQLSAAEESSPTIFRAAGSGPTPSGEDILSLYPNPPITRAPASPYVPLEQLIQQNAVRSQLAIDAAEQARLRRLIENAPPPQFY